MSNLQEKYKKEIVPELQKKFGLENFFQCPKVEKVVVNAGIGKLMDKESSKKEELIKKISDDLALVTGQRPQTRRARKSISGFSLRQGAPVGLMITLRGKRMYQFLERLIHVVLPRIRDFQGIKESSIDSKGNLTIGISEQLVFPEISPDHTEIFFGMEITVVTTAKNKEEGRELLRKIGIPLTEK